ncbi:hypothetical protein [Streptomyces cupreus]|uniref:Uncharacterized protein n=1 Tax=Streptomyces cupreus TaxID=2759956 RepID=A0A7X1J2P5_9ACTN|nr:hypothetical protein [Streptomyces cupreus]MBC2903131.1 hypothetical protein [Streptomyces cupreus]
MTPPESSAVAVELANLRGSFDRFGRDIGDIKTSCAVLVARSDRTEQDVRDLREELDQVRAELDGVKGRQWPLQSVAALASVTAIGLGVWQAVGR